MLVDCRASFSNLDAVNERLVLATCALIAKAHRIVRGQHTRKTAAFVKACLAYCHITVPSIDDPFRRLHLFLLCAQVALVNQCLPQADTCLKQAVAMVPDIAAAQDGACARCSHLPLVPLLHREPRLHGRLAASILLTARRVLGAVMTVQQRRETEEALLAFLGSLASTMVVAPGHPEHGALYLVKGLVKALQAYPWQEGGTGKARAFLHLLPLLTALSQPSLPYHIDKGALHAAARARWVRPRPPLTATPVQWNPTTRSMAALPSSVPRWRRTSAALSRCAPAPTPRWRWSDPSASSRSSWASFRRASSSTRGRPGARASTWPCSS